MPGAVRRQHLLLDAADRQHVAAQRDLAGHRDVAAHPPSGEQRHQRHGDGHARRGPVLRYGALRHVQVDVRLLEVGGDAQLLDVGAHPRQGRARRLLHDVAELAGEDQAPLARASREASMKRMSPPVGVQARPVETPGISVRSAASE